MSVSKYFSEKGCLFERTFICITNRNSTDINSTDDLVSCF